MPLKIMGRKAEEKQRLNKASVMKHSTDADNNNECVYKQELFSTIKSAVEEHTVDN